MTRFYLKGAALGFFLLVGAILLIHAQPYDDHDLRAMLLPEGCPSMCFLGIRPGVTTMDEAVKLLNLSGWVKEIYAQSLPTSIGWKWRDSTSDFVDSTFPANIQGSQESVYKIQGILSLSVIEIWWMFGKPTLMASQDLDSNIKFYYFWYSDQGAMFMSAAKACDSPINALLRKVVLFQFYSGATLQAMLSDPSLNSDSREVSAGEFNFRKAC